MKQQKPGLPTSKLKELGFFLNFEHIQSEWERTQWNWQEKKKRSWATSRNKAEASTKLVFRYHAASFARVDGLKKPHDLVHFQPLVRVCMIFDRTLGQHRGISGREFFHRSRKYNQKQCTVHLLDKRMRAYSNKHKIWVLKTSIPYFHSW